MHYYQFNIGDYIANTARLSDLEDLCYRRLLDLYYLNEQPFNDCSTSVAREIGMVENVDIVKFILGKYFQLNDGFWRQKRADREITFYRSKLKSASKAGKASAKARKLKASEQPLNDSYKTVQPINKHKPITNKHKPIKKNVPYQEIVDLFNEILPELTSVTTINPKRKTAIKKCVAMNEVHRSLDFWRVFYNAVREDSFIMRLVPRTPKWENFNATFDFVIREDNFIKIIEANQ